MCLRAPYRHCDFYTFAQALPRRRADQLAGSRRRFASTAPVLLAGPPAVELSAHIDHRAHAVATPSPKPPALDRARPRLRRARLGLGAITFAVLALVAVLVASGGVPNDLGFGPAASRPTAAQATTPAIAPSTSQVIVSTAEPSGSLTPLPTSSPIPSISIPPTAPPTATPSPPASAPPSPTATRTPFEYTVQQNDTLGAIAKKFGTTIAAIQAANDMGSGTTIYIGDTLIIP